MAYICQEFCPSNLKFLFMSPDWVVATDSLRDSDHACLEKNA